jgi:hypothetical protein
MKARHIVAGLLAAVLVSGGVAQARIGAGKASFDESAMVKKLGYKPMSQQRIVQGTYKDHTAYQYMAPDSRSFIDIIISPKGVIVEQAMLLPIQPNPIDAARFVEFMREATNNKADMNAVFEFMYHAVQQAKDSSKKFGSFMLRAYPLVGIVVDVKVTAASGSGAQQ